MSDKNTPITEPVSVPNENPIYRSRKSKSSYKLRVECLMAWMRENNIPKHKRKKDTDIPTEVYNQNIKR